jgi:hypothetical protein
VAVPVLVGRPREKPEGQLLLVAEPVQHVGDERGGQFGAQRVESHLRALVGFRRRLDHNVVDPIGERGEALVLKVGGEDSVLGEEPPHWEVGSIAPGQQYSSGVSRREGAGFDAVGGKRWQGHSHEEAAEVAESGGEVHGFWERRADRIGCAGGTGDLGIGHARGRSRVAARQSVRGGSSGRGRTGGLRDAGSSSIRERRRRASRPS